MAPIPRDKSLDSALALLSDGYTLISKRCQRYQFEIFKIRLMLRKVVCVTGEEATKRF
jgi:fatty-acid peroxygenase